MIISKEEFGIWKDHIITKQFFEALKKEHNFMNLQLLDSANLMGDYKEIIRGLGKRDALELVLDLKAEDISDNENESDRL